VKIRGHKMTHMHPEESLEARSLDPYSEIKITQPTAHVDLTRDESNEEDTQVALDPDSGENRGIFFEQHQPTKKRRRGRKSTAQRGVTALSKSRGTGFEGNYPLQHAQQPAGPHHLCPAT
jgi:hypothetical protein